MTKENANLEGAELSRRDFLTRSAAMSASVAALMATGNYAWAAGSDTLKVGLIGCGGRGTGAAKDCVTSSPNVVIYAMGDLFQDRLEGSLKNLRGEGAGGKKKEAPAAQATPAEKEKAAAAGAKKADKAKAGKKRAPAAPMGDKINVAPERCFTGFDAYKKVLDSGVDLVILATPPHFRPLHLRAAIEAGKHVFMEKPVAVDPVGARSVIESSELAANKGLAIVAGTQRRHTASYVEMMQRVHDGAIGDLLGGQCYWNQGFLWVKKHLPEWSDMEWQIRNWLYFTWLSGDHIVEQHVHNIDVMNWAFGGPPVKCMGMGGRQVRTGEECGNIFDHFAVEFEYANGARVMSMCRQIDGCAHRNGERIVGAKGVADSRVGITGANPFKYEGPSVNGQVQEHADLIQSIREGKPLNEGKRIAESSLTAIMGRMSAYTGNEISWNWLLNESKLDLTPPKYELGPLPVAPVAVPGKTKLIEEEAPQKETPKKQAPKKP